MPFSFSHRKATQALNFFARQSGNRINKLKALKLVFFADRYHFRKFGRPVTNDEYLAMPYGPVASGSKDLAELSEFLSANERSYAEQFLRPAPDDRHAYLSRAAVDGGTLSESDFEALDFAWRTFGHIEQFQLAELTHAYPEWKRHESALAGPGVSRTPMDYADFLLDPESNDADPCHSLTKEDQEDRREMLAATAGFESRWR